MEETCRKSDFRALLKTLFYLINEEDGINVFVQEAKSTQTTNEDPFLISKIPCTFVTINKKQSKGQLISKCPFGIIVLTKIPTKLFLDFCPEMFCTFLGPPGSFWGFLQVSLFMILLTKSPGSPQEGTKNYRNNFVGILEETIILCGHYKIN